MSDAPGTSSPLTDITVEETSFHLGGGDETVPAPRWLLPVDVMEDVGRCNRLHKLTSRPDAGTLVHISLLCPDRLIHNIRTAFTYGKHHIYDIYLELGSFL